MTAEREKEIREGYLLLGDMEAMDYCRELLAEIDRLRNDYRNSLSDTVKVLKGRDKLREERDGLYGDLIGQEHRLGLKCEMAEKERDQLREKLAVALFALVTSYDFIERIRARVALVEPFYTLSGKAKLIIEEALSTLKNSTNPQTPSN